MRKILTKTSETENPGDQALKEIEFAWALVDWRTFDPISPKQAFPGVVVAILPAIQEQTK
jgi:hypothetical protein